jgi:hypothetical protein
MLTGLLVLVASFSALCGASAIPSQLMARSDVPQCSPNLAGHAWSIYHSPFRQRLNEWTPTIANGGQITIVPRFSEDAEAWDRGEFLVPMTGQTSGTYQFK